MKVGDLVIYSHNNDWGTVYRTHRTHTEHLAIVTDILRMRDWNKTLRRTSKHHEGMRIVNVSVQVIATGQRFHAVDPRQVRAVDDRDYP